jgi:hypothetical protein
MAHHIHAVLLKGDFDQSKAETFEMKLVPLEHDITMICLASSYCDHWSEKLGIPGRVYEKPLLNLKVVHHMVNEVTDDPLFALIETDYANGIGTQAAAVYKGAEVVMAPEAAGLGSVRNTIGPINRAIRHLGVKCGCFADEFDILGLGNYRSFDDIF